MHAGYPRKVLFSTTWLRRVPVLLLAGPALFGAGDALAQAAAPVATAQAAAPAPAADTQVQEVIVTAQKRAEPLEKVPVAVQVVSGQALREENFNNLQDIGQIVPDLHIVNTGSFSDTLNIRGIGSGAQNPAFDQSVATFVDDIYYGRSRTIQSTFLDLDRVEVLKGPQSTFFGNNAIAGALNIVTKKPDQDFDGYVRALYGSYNTYAVEGAANLPVNDQLAVRVAGTTSGNTGWIHNVNTGKSAPDDQNYQGRATILWRPIDAFDATLKVEGGTSLISGATSNTPGQYAKCPPAAPLKVSSLNNFCGMAIANNIPLGLDNDLNSTLPGQFARLENDDDVLTMNYRRWGLTFTSVTGYTHYNFTAADDNAGLGPVVASTVATEPETYHQFSEELRVTSPANQPIEYLAGAYYQTDRLAETIAGNASYIDANLPTYAKLGYLSAAQLAAVSSLLPLAYATPYTQDETVTSLFGSLTWNATNKLKFNGGVRGTYVDKRFSGSIEYGQATQTFGGFAADPAGVQQSLGFLLGKPGTYDYSRHDRALLGNLGVQYQVVPQAMTYFNASRGFKAGGFNALSPGLIGGVLQPVFGPEYVNSYEVGLKSKWLNNRLLINLDGFREDYSDLQLSALIALPTGTAQNGVANAGSAISQGVELETQFVATSHFRFTADVTYLDAHYESYPNAAPTALQKQNKMTSQNLAGQPLDFAPHWSGSISGEYRAELGGGFRLIAELSPIMQTSYFASAGSDDPNLKIPGSLRLDGKITLERPSQHWAVDLIGKNLTDAVIPLTYGTNNLQGGKQEPLNISGQFRYRW